VTRINIIDVSELTDQHLIAEYREITMVPGSLRRTLVSKIGYQEKKVPKKFTLNGGHVYFFYNKGKYLYNRYQELISEMKRRGFKPDSNRKFPRDIFKENGLYNDWIPTIEDQKIIRQRIAERIASKPNWYRKTEY
tara:strand:- start:2112 stop:2519 length:408 start_codon:yes stop_codon:yes gene_type:complete